MELPKLLETSVERAGAAGATYRVEGELVPALTVELSAGARVYFEHHVILWKDPQVPVTTKALKGALKRMVAGMQIFVTQAEGPGRIAFSRDGPGHVLALHLEPGREVDVREHQFLAATDNVGYSFSRVKGVANMLFGGSGFFVDKFRTDEGEGIVWLHGYGNVFELELQAGETIDIEPGGWLYKDASVQMQTVAQRLKTGLLGSAGMLAFNRFTGPGRVALQSMYLHLPTET